MDSVTYNQEISTGWVENLALEELNMDESGVINFNDHLNPVHQLEESSIIFINQLRDYCEVYVQKFNEYRGGNHQSGALIKIFKIANTINDFMLFRNSLRLIFSRKANDLITVGFLSNTGELLPARPASYSDCNHDGLLNQITHEIRAHIGPFNNITWRFQNEPVDLDSMVKYYLSEFIRNSAR